MRFQNTAILSQFGLYLELVDFADKRKLQNFVGMSQYGLESCLENQTSPHPPSYGKVTGKRPLNTLKY